ncbi:MAG: NAD-dependent deacetylase [Anaerolineae bacterium]|jgi:NAD-dependent deacetylase
MDYADEVEYADEIERAATLLCEARHAVALTGAGISTPSGIPDFRSPGSGLWERANPMIVASTQAFRIRPKAFFDWVRPLAERVMAAEPNPAHLALAELEAAGRLQAVITQNIDGLHQKAGSREVLEVHGHVREATCSRCHAVAPTGDFLEDFLGSSEVPRCAACGGVMKPNVVLFGEQLPADVLDAAQTHIRQTDLLLVVGSHLDVMPVSQLPFLVHERGGRVIVVNLMDTYIDAAAEVVIHADVADVLPRIVQACEEG